MLADHDAMATVAVKDLDVARKFYEGTLGLKPGQARPEVLSYSSGKTNIIVYKSQYAGTNQATTATWAVGHDIDAIVAALKAKGVKFEHYDLPGLTLQGDLHVAGNFKGAWLKDPDGNILHILNG
jgi:catechol 2,3-dioxygenase-like lactoylglutathione lyase family enzyme